jgi:oligopeptidase A
MGQSTSTTRLLLLSLVATTILITMLSLSRFSLTRSISLPAALLTTQSLRKKPSSLSCPVLPLSHPFSAYLRQRTRSHRPICAATMASGSTVDPTPSVADSDNPLLKDFDFPPFDVVEPKHVRPGIRELIRRLVCYSFFFFSLLFEYIVVGW